MNVYDAIVIDVMNFAYRVFHHKDLKAGYVNKKQVYKEAVCNFIAAVDDLIAHYGDQQTLIYLLFDNPNSRISMQSSFYYASRKDLQTSYKENRTKEPKEFYNSINLLRYYYMVSSNKYHTVQIPRLEADDLVQPLLNTTLKDKKVLLVSNDLDWTRYLSANVSWLAKDVPEDVQTLSTRLAFPITVSNVVLYKSLFGDPSDNIAAIASKSQYFDQFLVICNNVSSPLEALAYAAHNQQLQLCSLILDNQQQFRINVQLTSTIQIDDRLFAAHDVEGRDSKAMWHAVRYAIDLDNSDKKYQFGNIRRPRV